MTMIFTLILALVAANSDIAETQSAPLVDPDNSKIVAEVGSSKVTVGEFLDAYNNRISNSTEKYHPSMKDNKAAKAFLTDLITIQAILQSALAEGYDKRQEFLTIYSQHEETTLTNALMGERAKSISVTDEEVKSFYDNAQLQYKLRYIMLEKQDDAQKATELAKRKGTDFAKLAKELSHDEQTKNNGGLIDVPIKYWPIEPFISIFKLSKGQISDPLPLPNNLGWGVFQVLDIVKVNDPPPFEDIKETFKKQLYEMKYDQMRLTLLDEALAESKVERNEAAIKILYEGDPEEWEKPETQALIVSSVDGRPISFKTWYESARFYFPDIAKGREEHGEHFQLAMNDRLTMYEKNLAVVSMCYKLGIDKQPEVADQLQRFRERELCFAYLADNVESKIPAATDEQIQAYYDAHKSEPTFQETEKLSLTVVNSDQKERIEEFMKRKDALAADVTLEKLGEDMRKEIKMRKDYKIPADVNPSLYEPISVFKQDMDSANTDTKEVYDQLRQLPIGEWSPIVEKDKMFMAGRLDKIIEARTKTLEETKPLCTQRVEEEIRQDPKTDKLCADLLAGIRNKYKTKIYVGVLELARKKAAAIPLPKAESTEGGEKLPEAPPDSSDMPKQ